MSSSVSRVAQAGKGFNVAWGGTHPSALTRKNMPFATSSVLPSNAAGVRMDTLAQSIAPASDWFALLPEIGVGALALLVLVLELVLPGRFRHFIVNATLAGLAAIAAGASAPLFRGAAGEGAGSRELFGGLVAQTGLFDTGGAGLATSLARMFFPAAAFFTVWLGARYLRRRALPVTEFLHIVLVVTGALMLLVQSNHFLLLFVALETVAVGFYILAGYNRESGASLEAGVKYLVTGGVSSAFLLFGIVLLYGVAGNPAFAPAGAGGDMLGFAAVRGFIAAHPSNPLAIAGVALVVGGVAFKIGAFPFQIWVPDVYQGAPTPVAAFLAVASKAAGVMTLLILFDNPFSALVATREGGAGPLHALLSVMIGATLIFANLTALGQTNVKRLMGLSGLSHAGFLMLAVLAAQHQDARALALPALAAYLAAYMAGAFATFGVVNEMSANATAEGDADVRQDIDDYQRLMHRSPLLAGVLGCSLSSLAGIPPTAGFVAKFLVIAAALKAGLWVLTAIAILSVGAGVYYYFAWMREAFQRVWLAEERLRELFAPVHVPVGSRLVLLGLTAVILVGGVVQGVWSFFMKN